ncbi:MAG: ferritin-like domain-containing protein [Bacteroidota bacterium]
MTSNKTVGKTQGSTEEYGTEDSKLMKLFEEQLKDMYWAEKALTKAMPKIIKNVSSQELAEAIQDHLDETESQVGKVERVFQTFDKKAVAKKCEAMDGLIKEVEEIMRSSDKGSMRDAGIIAAVQKIEHYEIATYGTLRTFAKTLGLTEAASVLEAVLQEEKDADEKLTEIAVSSINENAMSEME